MLWLSGYVAYYSAFSLSLATRQGGVSVGGIAGGVIGAVIGVLLLAIVAAVVFVAVLKVRGKRATWNHRRKCPSRKNIVLYTGDE